jgi:hypothetical protein
MRILVATLVAIALAWLMALPQPAPPTPGTPKPPAPRRSVTHAITGGLDTAAVDTGDVCDSGGCRPPWPAQMASVHPGQLVDIQHESGWCWLVDVPWPATSLRLLGLDSLTVAPVAHFPTGPPAPWGFPTTITRVGPWLVIAVGRYNAQFQIVSGVMGVDPRTATLGWTRRLDASSVYNVGGRVITTHLFAPGLPDTFDVYDNPPGPQSWTRRATWQVPGATLFGSGDTLVPAVTPHGLDVQFVDPDTGIVVRTITLHNHSQLISEVQDLGGLLYVLHESGQFGVAEMSVFDDLTGAMVGRWRMDEPPRSFYCERRP